MVKELLWPTALQPVGKKQGEGVAGRQGLTGAGNSSELEQLIMEKGETSSVGGYKLIEEDVDKVEEKVKVASGEFVNSDVKEEDKSVGED